MKPKRFLLLLVVMAVAFSAIAAFLLFSQSTKAYAAEAPPPAPPELGELSISPTDGVVPVKDSVIDFTVVFTDPGFLSELTFTWNWGDATTTSCPPETAECSFDYEDYGDGVRGEVFGSHAYQQPGVYSVQLEVRDNDQFDMATYNYVVAYDASAGFVTGGGWIDSPPEAYTPDPTLAGKATFGFVSRYKNGATLPTGSTVFQFKMANMNFHSENYQWLVISGHKAQYKGTGTINGGGNYGFMLTAIDADLTTSLDVDQFRIKIWDKDNGDAVIYDNQRGAEDNTDPNTAISGGSIVIHKEKDK
jgi:hypothetical protein